MTPESDTIPEADADSGRPFTVTFITPSQSSTIGGTISIQQFARHLTRLMRVNLVVRGEETVPLGGVSIHHSSDLRAEELPDADATVLYINAPDPGGFFDLPDSKGERLLMFQGYTELESQMVRERLTRGLRVLTISRWLNDEARRFGAQTFLTPVGLDREIFFPGPPTDQRAQIVTMKYHPLYWKGAGDGIRTLEIVKQARSNVELRLFGVDPPSEPLPFEGEFLSLPSQREVAELLRESAVFVCSSWEEGFGMPGLEALASGAALATTDTKGSRDYATDEQTALVSPPRKPELLAENVLRLLDDLELRRKLTKNALEEAPQRFKPWPEAAQVMADALTAGTR